MDKELDASTADAYHLLETNAHFREIGKGLGLVRLRRLIEGKIADLRESARKNDYQGLKLNEDEFFKP